MSGDGFHAPATEGRCFYVTDEAVGATEGIGDMIQSAEM